MLQEGQEILEGRFRIIKKLGSGAFGEIFKVEKKKTGEIFAAKFVSITYTYTCIIKTIQAQTKYT